MSTLYSDIDSLLDDKRRDSGTNSISAATLFRAVQSMINLMQQIHCWEFCIKKSTVVFHKGITWYADPTDFKAAIDLRYQKAPNRSKEFAMVSPNNFDSQTLKTRRFTIATDESQQYLRIQAEGDVQDIDACSEYDSGGTWVGASGITNVATDSYEFYDETASTKFDFDGTAGTLTKTFDTAIDLEKYKDRGKVYLNVYLPTVTNFSSVAMKLGSSSIAYYTATATTDYLGNSVVAGWNKLEFDVWDSETGTVDDKNIDYIQLTVAYSSTPNDTDFRIENIFCSEDIPLDLVYYSLYMVYDATASAWVQNFIAVTDTSDYPLWSGRFDFVTPAFVNMVMEEIFWITGETDDREKARQRQIEILNDLKRRLPSRRRYPELQLSVEI